MEQQKFTDSERKAVSTLAAVLALRLIGLFMILPVLALHADDFIGSTPFLIGMALGIYGLSQAILQVPFGAASDRWGRKPILVLGLVIFACGSMIAAESTTIYGIIIGRALQGAGAIAAVVLAFVGDLTRESQRTKAMAVVGVSIGTAFTLALILGPSLNYAAGLRGLFWLAAAMAVVGLFLVWRVVPSVDCPADRGASDRQVSALKDAVLDRNLIRLYSGTLTIHAVMTSLFLAFPIELIEASGLARTSTWKIYAPVFVLSFAVMIPLIRFGSRKEWSRAVMLCAAVLLVVAHCGLIFGSANNSLMVLVVSLWLFFVGFNVLEAIFPSTTVSAAHAGRRGMVMGIFNTCTFSGAFAGGIVAGLVYGEFGATGVFLIAGIAILLWIAFECMVSVWKPGLKPQIRQSD